MSEEWEKYVNDSRIVCKYGAKCYQKNPEHHKTYKHPPKPSKRKGTNKVIVNKRLKVSHQLEPTDVLASSSTEETSSKKTNETSDTRNCVITSNDEKNKIILPEKIEFYEPTTDVTVFQNLFLVKMPEDFFKFYQCLCEEYDNVEKFIGSVNLQLVGPYDLLLGKLPILQDKELYLVHWRFFYDPPEFQTVMKTKGKSEFHIGYYRDSPEEEPVFLASNDSSKDCHITPVSQNIFGAFYNYLQNEKKRSPFVAMICQKGMDKVKEWAEKWNYTLEPFNNKKRISVSITKTLHGAGIVVPYNKKNQIGYRPLVETDANIKKIFNRLKEAKTVKEKDKVLSDLQPVITYANIAVDECDFGTGLEAGLDLFCSGLKELEPSALSALSSVYFLLNREAFAKIVQAHIKYRRAGPDMSILSLN